MSTSLYENLPFGRILAILTKDYYGALTKRLEYLEIERHYSILIFIEKINKSCTQQYICDHLRIDKVSMVRILDDLVIKDYVVKIANPNDRREHFIELTPKAIKTLPFIHEAVSEVNTAAFKGIEKEKQNELYDYLSIIQTNLMALPTQNIFINYKKSNK